MELSNEKKTKIDAMDFEQMLRLQRYAPIGAPMFQYGPEYDYFVVRMNRLRAEDPDAAVTASKSIGWE